MRCPPHSRPLPSAVRLSYNQPMYCTSTSSSGIGNVNASPIRITVLCSLIPTERKADCHEESKSRRMCATGFSDVLRWIACSSVPRATRFTRDELYACMKACSPTHHVIRACPVATAALSRLDTHEVSHTMLVEQCLSRHSTGLHLTVLSFAHDQLLSCFW